MMRRTVAGLSLLLMLVWGRIAPAAENALDAISTDASVVIRLKSPSATIDKVAELVNQVVPGAGEEIKKNADGIGFAISNPTLAGVDKSADWWVAVYASADRQEPGVVFVIPAIDLKAMKEGTAQTPGGGEVKFMEHGKHGVYTDDDAAAAKTAARIKGEGKSISTLIEKDSDVVFAKGDISLFINVAQLATTYKAALEDFRSMAGQVLENPPEGAGPPGVDIKALAGAAKQILEGLLNGLDDTKSCTIAAAVSKEGLAFEDLVRVKSGSATDKYFAGMTPSALATLASLPPESLGYLGIQVDMSGLLKLTTALSGAALNDNPDAAKALQELVAEMSKIKLGATSSAFNLGSIDEGAIRTVSVTETADGAKLRALAQKTAKAMGTIEVQGIKQTYKYEADSEKFGKNSADVTTVTTEMDDAGNPLGAMMDRFMKSLYGPDGMVTRTIYLKDRVVMTMGGGKQAMAQALEGLDKKPGQNGKSPFQKTRDELAPKANILVLFDLPGTISRALELVAESGLLPPGAPVDAEMFKGLEIKRSYLGLSVATEPQGLRVKTQIPIEQIGGMARIVLLFRSVAGG